MEVNEDERNLKKKDEGVVAVGSRTSSWALSSSQGVDEVVDDAEASWKREGTRGHVPRVVVKCSTQIVDCQCGCSFFSMLSSTPTRCQKVGEGDSHFYVFETGVTNL